MTIRNVDARPNRLFCGISRGFGTQSVVTTILGHDSLASMPPSCAGRFDRQKGDLGVCTPCARKECKTPVRIQDRLFRGRHDQGRRAPHDINEVDVQRPRPEFIPTRRACQDEQASKSRTQPPPRKIHRCLLPDPRHSLGLERILPPCRVSRGHRGGSRADRRQSRAHKQEPTIPAGSRADLSAEIPILVPAIEGFRDLDPNPKAPPVRPSASTSEVQPLGATTHYVASVKLSG